MCKGQTRWSQHELGLQEAFQTENDKCFWRDRVCWIRRQHWKVHPCGRGYKDESHAGVVNERVGSRQAHTANFSHWGRKQLHAR
ncbi:hypothetical protein DPMN_051530 [Dreissena polymorpha]|uniref:Uncharacterized protein n=1 Tax=Dreissena polymorpha TaxID=45954 RepID=A0A9D4HP02_DREPO|nr:hypothetical protein DPMN_051530 [Dreissena polymorpha]